MPANCRAEVARAIAAVIGGGQSLDEPLARALGKVAVADRGLAQELCYGVLRFHPRLNGILEQLLARPLPRGNDELRALLLAGIYQLAHTRIPDHAVLSETVNAARALGKAWAAGLVNGVLRNFLRRRQELESGLEPAAAAAHPRWLYEALAAAWPEQRSGIIEANNCPPPMCLRVHRGKLSAAAYREKLEAAGIEAEPGALSEDGLRLKQPMPVSRLPGFAEGEASVQDEAAQLAAIALDAQPGERVLDACAAPGGKACHILERQPALAELVAADSDAGRLERVKDNLARLGLRAELRVLDARASADQGAGIARGAQTGAEAGAESAPPPFPPASFDRILADVPCSGSGVIRRHPDIKVLRRAADIPAFAELQRDILAGLWPLLKPGGRLLYATCSVFPAENLEVVAGFISTTADARLLPLPLSHGIDIKGARQLLPAPEGGDGFYYALLEKRADAAPQ